MSKLYIALLLSIYVYAQEAHAAPQSGGDAEQGAAVFLKYCAGCHGFEGQAEYENAPSFAMGERMQKDDRELLRSVLNGKNNMPPWRDKLPVQDLRNAIAYLRLMYERKERGEDVRQDDIPDIYYMFKPVGEKDMDWAKKEVKE